jgi:DNA-binding MarR family transcriptional regulator
MSTIPNRLTDLELAAWRGMLDTTMQLRRNLHQVIAEASGLSEADFVVLLALVESPTESVRASDLAEQIDWDRSRLSHHLGRMQTRGLIERKQCETDSRGTELNITSAGRQAMREATGPHFAELKKLFANKLTEAQLTQLVEISQALANR